MTHFTVLVVAKNEEELDAKLLPYHEYECTGIEEYIEFVPLEDGEAENDYKEQQEKGNYLDSTLEEFVHDWYGSRYYMQDGKWGRKTNPNNRWDWYQVGGRWSDWGRTMNKADLYALRDRRIADSLQDYRKFNKARLTAVVSQERVKHWADFLNENSERANYWNAHYHHDAVELAKDEAAFKAIEWHFWGMDEVKEFNVTEEEFLNKKSSVALVTSLLTIVAHGMSGGVWVGLVIVETKTPTPMTDLRASSGVLCGRHPMKICSGW